MQNLMSRLAPERREQVNHFGKSAMVMFGMVIPNFFPTLAVRKGVAFLCEEVANFEGLRSSRPP